MDCNRDEAQSRCLYRIVSDRRRVYQDSVFSLTLVTVAAIAAPGGMETVMIVIRPQQRAEIGGSSGELNGLSINCEYVS